MKRRRKSQLCFASLILLTWLTLLILTVISTINYAKSIPSATQDIKNKVKELEQYTDNIPKLETKSANLRERKETKETRFREVLSSMKNKKKELNQNRKEQEEFPESSKKEITSARTEFKDSIESHKASISDEEGSNIGNALDSIDASDDFYRSVLGPPPKLTLLEKLDPWHWPLTMWKAKKLLLEATEDEWKLLNENLKKINNKISVIESSIEKLTKSIQLLDEEKKELSKNIQQINSQLQKYGDELKELSDEEKIEEEVKKLQKKLRESPKTNAILAAWNIPSCLVLSYLTLMAALRVILLSENLNSKVTLAS